MLLLHGQEQSFVKLSPSVEVGAEEPLEILGHGSESSPSVEEIKFLIIFFVTSVSPHFCHCNRGIRRILTAKAGALNVTQLLATLHGMILVHDLLFHLVSLAKRDLRIWEGWLLFNFILIVLFKLSAT